MKTHRLTIILVGLLSMAAGYGTHYFVSTTNESGIAKEEQSTNVKLASDSEESLPSLREAERALRESYVINKTNTQVNLRWDKTNSFLEEHFVDADVFSIYNVRENLSSDYKETVMREVIFVLNDYVEDYAVRVTFSDERREYWSLRDKEGEKLPDSDDMLWKARYESGPFKAEDLIRSVLSDDVVLINPEANNATQDDG